MVLLKLLFTVGLADFISGCVHWLEDTYARPGMPLVGKIAEENLRHHARPREFLNKSWWESSSDLLLLGLLVVLGAQLMHRLDGWVLLFVLLTVNANQIHKWAHRGPKENPGFVTWLQQMRLVQTAREHARHHSGQRNSHYCVITNFLNPLLERVSFWRGLENLIAWIGGVKPRNDAAYLMGVRR
jgi:ubiquitin-conjugating enzyme E2 variant